MMKETLILGPVSDVVSLLGFGIAAISPPVVKSFRYYLKQPCVVVEYNENGLSISNNSSLPIKARMEYLVKIKVQKGITPDKAYNMLPPRQSYSRSMPQGMWKSFESDDDTFLQPNTKHSIPLGPELVSHTELKIRISPTVRASEIKVARFTEKTWPRVYDDVKLKPVGYLITVNGNGEISVSSAE